MTSSSHANATYHVIRTKNQKRMKSFEFDSMSVIYKVHSSEVPAYVFRHLSLSKNE